MNLAYDVKVFGHKRRLSLVPSAPPFFLSLWLLCWWVLVSFPLPPSLPRSPPSGFFFRLSPVRLSQKRSTSRWPFHHTRSCWQNRRCAFRTSRCLWLQGPHIHPMVIHRRAHGPSVRCRLALSSLLRRRQRSWPQISLGPRGRRMHNGYHRRVLPTKAIGVCIPFLWLSPVTVWQ